MTTDSSMAAPALAETPGSSAASAIRYRCAACGNLTRFSVVTNRRTKAFHHFSVGGELTLEDVEVLDETVEEVSCRWCGNGNAIETVDNAEIVDNVETGSPTPN